MLTRTAAFGLLGDLDRVEDAVARAGLRGTRNGRNLTVDLGANASLKAREHRPNSRNVRVMTTIGISQSREPDAIAVVLSNRWKSHA